MLNLAYLNLKMGFLDESLRSLTEALRISQNNNDNESINYCIIYLFKISAVLGHYKDAINLNEHAIIHSITHNNPYLLQQSCLAHSALHRNYDLSQKSDDVLRQKNIYWHDTLQIASKKLSERYEGCTLIQNELDKERKLDIPKGLEMIEKAITYLSLSKPELASLLINTQYALQPSVLRSDYIIESLLEIIEMQAGYNPLESLQSLRLVAQFLNYNRKPNYQFYLLCINAQFFINRMDFKSAEFVLDQMQVLQQQICDPLISSKYLAYKNQLLIREGKLHESYISVLETIDFLTSKGYCKAQLIREKLNLASLKYQNGDVFSALIDLESIKKKCKLYALQELQNFARLLQALILVHQGNLVRSAQLLKSKQTSGRPRSQPPSPQQSEHPLSP